MALCIRKGAAIVALFSAFSVMADDHPEGVFKGNQKNPHKPPEWIFRLVSAPAVVRSSEFKFEVPQVKSTLGNPHKTSEKKACRQQNGDWGFCDL
jgi:hypothetical protein